MTKSSTDHAELAGLRITLANIPYHKSTLTKDNEQIIKSWLESRIKELEAK